MPYILTIQVPVNWRMFMFLVTMNCAFCRQGVVNQSSLTRHLRYYCKPLCPSTAVSTDEGANEIIESLTLARLKWKCAQKLGVVVPKLYPLVFTPKRKRQNSDVLVELSDILPIENSEFLLEKILLEENIEEIALLKSIKIEHEGTTYDLSPFAIPDNGEKFTLTNYEHFVEVKLANRESSLRRLRLDNNSDDSDMELSDHDDNPQNPANPVVPENQPHQNPQLPVVQNEITEEEKNAYINDIRGYREKGKSYEGLGKYACDKLPKFKVIFEDLVTANSRLQQYLSLFHFPEIMHEKEMKYLLGCGMKNFVHHLQNYSSKITRQRVFNELSKTVLYMLKMRHNPPLDYLAAQFNVSKETARTIFWQEVMSHLKNEKDVPFKPINYQRDPSHLDVLNENVCTSEFLLGIFEHIIPQGKKLVLLAGDHTYFYSGKFIDSHAQRSTFCEYKYSHCTKTMLIVTYTGKILLCSPSSGSITPRSGDGNLISATIEYELTDPRLAPHVSDLIRPPPDSDFVVVTAFDLGYTVQRASGDVVLNLEEFLYNPTLPGHNPLARMLTPIKPGGKILDDNFYPIDQDLPEEDEDTRRSKLNDQEANYSRLCTLIRHPVECANVGLKNYSILDARKSDAQYFDPLGEMADQFSHHPKMDAFAILAASMYNKNHKKWGEIKWPIPDGMSERAMGKNFLARTKMLNSFDPRHGVKYRKNLNRFPKSGRRPNENPLTNWVTTNYDKPNHAFPQIAQKNVTMVTMGSYHVKLSRRYITDIRHAEALEFIEENIGNGEIDWDNFDCLVASLPENLDVHFIDQN